VKQRDVACSPGTKSEVFAYDDDLGLESVNQNLSYEIGGCLLGKLFVESHSDEGVNPSSGHQGRLLFRTNQWPLKFAWVEQGIRVAIESHQNGFQIMLRASVTEFGNQSLVAAVNAIELADGNRGWAERASDFEIVD
jgi:hypothetical protein